MRRHEHRRHYGKLVRDLPVSEVAIAAITASELLHGAHRARTDGQRVTREAFVESILARLPVVSFDLIAARIHAGLWANMAAKRQMTGVHDLLIAATALASGYGVVTRDERSFPHIPGLRAEVWWK